MNSSTGILTLSQLQARELAGKRWLLNGTDLTFGDYDRSQPGQPPWKTGAEGIAYPLVGTDGQPRAYVKFFDELKVTPKRIARTKWLVEQRIDKWSPELRGAPNSWLDTQTVGRPAGTSFQFTCSMAQAVPGKTWLEVKLDIVEGAARFDNDLRQLCVENLIRGLVHMERTDMVHGDLSPNNVIVNLNAKAGDPALYLIDFDGFFADGTGHLAQLSIGEGGTFGTRGYCPPQLEQRAQQSDLTAAPYSDRYGRDMLLIELLCFDEECDFEDPASEWNTEKIQRRLSQSAAGEHLRHLAAENVFQLPEDWRPTSYELARKLGIPTPPRIKRRARAVKGGWYTTWGGRWSIGSGRWRANVVVALWALCLVHWALICVYGAAWLVSAPEAQQESDFMETAVSLAGRGLLGLGVFLVGAVGLSILAFTEDQPRLIRFGGFGFQIPARRNQSQPYSQHLRAVTGWLAAIFALLVLVVLVGACSFSLSVSAWANDAGRSGSIGMNQDRRKKSKPRGQRHARRERGGANKDNGCRALIGRHKNVTGLAATYLDLSRDDEQAATILQREGQYRQAVYFFLQAMEKLARYAIFCEMGPDAPSSDGQTYRQRTRTHDLDILLTVLLEVFKETINDSRVSDQIEQQMNAVVLQGQLFGLLHNDVRYPRYMDRRKRDVLLELNAKDASMAADKNPPD